MERGDLSLLLCRELESAAGGRNLVSFLVPILKNLHPHPSLENSEVPTALQSDPLAHGFPRKSSAGEPWELHFPAGPAPTSARKRQTDAAGTAGNCSWNEKGSGPVASQESCPWAGGKPLRLRRRTVAEVKA